MKVGKLESTRSAAVSRSQQEVAEAQIAEDVRAIMALPAGRRFIYRLIYDICGVENGIWVPSAEIHYLEGRRSVGIAVKNEAQQIASRDYILMIQERILAAAQLSATRVAVEEDE